MLSPLTTRLVVAVSLVFGISATALAQYGGGGGSSSGGTYSSGGYKSSTGIAIGAGAAAGVAIAYLALHKTSVVGCVESSTDGVKLMNEKDRKTYSLAPGSEDLKPGQRVELKGKKTKESSGKLSFQVQKLAKDYGACAR